jgi:VanZ family protein
LRIAAAGAGCSDLVTQATRLPHYRMKRFLKYWLPSLIWLAVIFLGSTDLMSTEHTSRFIVPFLRWLRPEISPETIASIQFVVRKFAHLGEYTILALLLFRAVICGTNLKRSMGILYVSVWIACVFVATTDEFHQSFVESRSASVRDVMVDSSGAIFGLLIGAGLVTRRSKKLEGTRAKS